MPFDNLLQLSVYMSSQKPQLLPVPNRLPTFWLSEPDPSLENARTTDELPPSVDVVIIGSGMSGAITAYHLFKDQDDASPSVLMLEAAETCSGATARNGELIPMKVRLTES